MFCGRRIFKEKISSFSEKLGLIHPSLLNIYELY